MYIYPGLGECVRVGMVGVYPGLVECVRVGMVGVCILYILGQEEPYYNGDGWFSDWFLIAGPISFFGNKVSVLLVTNLKKSKGFC